MKLINDKGRLFGLVNPVDALITLAILAGIFVVGWLVLSRGEVSLPGVKQTTIQATFLIPEARPEVLAYLHNGDIMKNDTSKAGLGKIADVRVENAKMDVPTDEGELKVGESQLLKDIYITVEANGRATDSMLMINGGIMSVGKNYFINSKWFRMNSVLVGVTPDANGR